MENKYGDKKDPFLKKISKVNRDAFVRNSIYLPMAFSFPAMIFTNWISQVNNFKGLEQLTSDPKMLIASLFTTFVGAYLSKFSWEIYLGERRKVIKKRCSPRGGSCAKDCFNDEQCSLFLNKCNFNSTGEIPYWHSRGECDVIRYNYGPPTYAPRNFINIHAE